MIGEPSTVSFLVVDVEECGGQHIATSIWLATQLLGSVEDGVGVARVRILQRLVQNIPLGLHIAVSAYLLGLERQVDGIGGDVLCTSDRFGCVLVVAGRGGGANDRRREQEPYSTRRLHTFILRAFQDDFQIKECRRLKSAIVRGADTWEIGEHFHRSCQVRLRTFALLTYSCNVRTQKKREARTNPLSGACAEAKGQRGCWLGQIWLIF